jgi:hypothetical protein
MERPGPPGRPGVRVSSRVPNFGNAHHIHSQEPVHGQILHWLGARFGSATCGTPPRPQPLHEKSRAVVSGLQRTPRNPARGTPARTPNKILEIQPLRAGVDRRGRWLALRDVGTALRGTFRGLRFSLAGCFFRLIPRSCYSFVQELLGIFKNFQLLRREVFASAIDIERQQAHTGRRPLGRYLLRREFPCNRLRIPVKQTGRRVGGICVDRYRPLTLSLGVAVREPPLLEFFATIPPPNFLRCSPKQ